MIILHVIWSGMMIETMAGKSGALHGLCHDCTPFTFSEDNPAIKHFGKLLVHGKLQIIIWTLFLSPISSSIFCVVAIHEHVLALKLPHSLLSAWVHPGALAIWSLFLYFILAGYNYYGNERLYSGIDGREFEADIFMGVVYYQRLRHMVSDKFQVRTTGPIDILTHQPVKGRKRAGGIRFGEMERDSLLAHGSSFLLQDRLLNCSDRSFVRNQSV